MWDAITSGTLRQNIFHEINGDSIADLTRELVRIPSVNPPGNENLVCEFIASWLEKRGIQTSLLEEYPGRTNLQAEIFGERENGRNLILNGHADVVPPGNGWTRDPFEGTIEGGRVYGRGAADMKGGLAAMMVVMDILEKNKKHLSGKAIFQAVADEEIGSPMGTGYLCTTALKADLAIVGEPTSLDVCVCHKGVLRFDVATIGRAAHSGMPEKGINAILHMNTIINVLREYGDKIAKNTRHPLLGPPTVNIGTIEGGVQVNIVPDRCKISAERRIVPPETIAQAERELKSTLAEAASKSPIKYEMMITNRSEPSEAKGEKALIDAILQGASEATNRTAIKRGFNGTCDARYLNIISKIPTVIFGPGRLEDAHKADESVGIEELRQAAIGYALTYLNLQSLEQK